MICMWSSQFFWKFLLITAGLNLLGVITFATMFIRNSDRVLTEEHDQRLHSAAILLRSGLAEQIDSDHPIDIQKTVSVLGKELGLRITLLDPGGTLLADSFYSPGDYTRAAENQKERLEILRAETSQDGFGRSERISPTQGMAMRYFAIRLGAKGDSKESVRFGFGI